jgi:chorismate mutase
MSSEIENFRKKIDNIDNQILELLSKRNELSIGIGKYKRENELKIRNPKRENEMLERIEGNANLLSLDKRYIKRLFKTIMRDSRKTQAK